MCQMTPQHSSLPPSLARSLPPSPAFFVCLPDSPGVSSSLGPESFPGESPPLEAALESGSPLGHGSREGLGAAQGRD